MELTSFARATLGGKVHEQVHEIVYVEDLCVIGFGRSRLATSAHDAGWSSFTRMLG